MASAQSPQLKNEVRDFWNAEPCGSRYLEGAEDFEAFDAHARSRYALEPHISQFAKFSLARGLRVLEIGVGMGADYLEWLKAGADTGLRVGRDSTSLQPRRFVAERALGTLPVGTVSAGVEILSAISGQEVRWTLGIVFADFGEEAGDQVRFAARNRRSFLPSPLSSASIQVSSPTEATKWTKSQRSSAPQRKKASRQVGPFVPSLRCPRS